MVEVFVPEFTEKARQEFLANGRRSLAFFTTTILGLNYWSAERGRALWRDDLQGDLCRFLEGRSPYGPWNRAVVAGFRGLGKSTITTQAYPLQRTLYGKNKSFKIVGNSSDNVKANHFLPMVELFRYSNRSDWLQWLFEERIPSGFDGWNSEQIVWVTDDPKALPAITYWGAESKFESYHGDGVILDDLEGADANRSNVSSESAFQIFLRSIPLLADPAYGQILVVGTPHGHEPFVHRLKERSDFKVWWKELLDESGHARDPERYPAQIIASLRVDSRLWNQQYMLRKDSGGDSPFDLEAYDRAVWRWHPTETRKITYPVREPEKEGEDEYGIRLSRRAERVVDLQEMVFYLHLDPKHKTKIQRKSDQTKADHAATVVGVSSDLHVFLVDYWAGDCSIEDYLKKAYRFYCLYACSSVTYESIGAQLWIVDIQRRLEESNPKLMAPETFGAVMPFIKLPRMSARMVAAENSVLSKENLYRERLTPWVNLGLFHGPAGARGELFRHQLMNVLDNRVEKDLIDCVVQGAGKHPSRKMVWSAPLGKLYERELVLRRQWVERRVDRRTGFSSPFWTPKLAPGLPSVN